MQKHSNHPSKGAFQMEVPVSKIKRTLMSCSDNNENCSQNIQKLQKCQKKNKTKVGGATQKLRMSLMQNEPSR
jgi:hypothetical protein